MSNARFYPKINTGTGQLKIIHILYTIRKKTFQFGMPICAAPVRDESETDGGQMLMAMELPVSARIRVAIQSQFQ